MSLEEDLERLDQQLDSRLKLLKGLRSSSCHTDVETTQRRPSLPSPNRDLEHELSNICKSVSDLNTGQQCTKEENLSQKDDESTCVQNRLEVSESQRKHEASQKQQSKDLANQFGSEASLKLPVPITNSANQEAETTQDEDENLKEEEQDAIFDEFLDQSTRYRISSLCKKVAHLNTTVQVLQDECKRLSSAKKDACTKAHEAETERRTLSKQVTTLQQQANKFQKSNKQLQDRMQEMNAECQALRKELSTSQHNECERRTSQSSLQTQLTRAHGENATLRDQISTLKSRHKEELDQLRGALGDSNSKVKELERQQRNLSALARKQDKLIGVLSEQKNNLAAAKAAAGLEEKFLAIISPLQPP